MTSTFPDARKPAWLDAHPQPFDAPLVRAFCTLVLDGDSLHCQADEGERRYPYRHLRLYGYNCPELSTPEGQVAREVARTLLERQPIRYQLVAVDKYGGRYDARVWGWDATVREWYDYGRRMYDLGHATVYTMRTEESDG